MNPNPSGRSREGASPTRIGQPQRMGGMDKTSPLKKKGLKPNKFNKKNNFINNIM